VPPSPSFPSGLALQQPSLFVQDLVTGPTGPGEFVWNARVVPAAATSLAPSDGEAFDVRARTISPQSLTVSGRYDVKRRVAVVTGRLTAGGRPRAGAQVSIAAEAGGDVSFGDSVTTTAQGTFSFQRPISARTRFTVSVAPQSVPCRDSSDAPGGCVSETIGSPPDADALVRPPRPTDPRVRTTAHDAAVARRSVLKVGDLPPAWRDLGFTFEPCDAFQPDLRRVTLTGQADGPIFGSPKSDANAGSVASVFKTSADAALAFDRIAQLDHARCEARSLLDDGITIETVAKAGFPATGEATRAFHLVWKSDEGARLNGDLVFVRVGRTVLELELLSLDGPRPTLVRSLAKALAARARS